METFIFNHSNFHFETNCHEGESKFDRNLISKWNAKMESGKVFWYQLKIPSERVLDKFLLQLNTDRSNLKRSASNIQQINQPFNAEGFNFNKVKDEEKLFNIVHEDNIAEHPNNVIIVNVSPLEYCHILLVPDPQKCQPQLLTRESLNLAVQLCLLSASSYFRVGFNSLGAYASVNHLHFHGYYLKREMYLEFCPVDNIAGPCFSIRNYPAKGFAFQIKEENEIESTVKNLYKVIELLLRENIPHNLFITHGKSFQSVETAGSEKSRDCLRIYIWARKPSWGIKELSAFNIAVCELFGHMVIKNENDYKTLTNEGISATLDDLTAEPYEKVYSNVVRIFENSN